jgi:hypothetical protein
VENTCRRTRCRRLTHSGGKGIIYNIPRFHNGRKIKKGLMPLATIIAGRVKVVNKK